ncbi:3-oxoacyl-[acyl-carrier-protein] synthase-1 [Reichenbachiella agariperforans]|uniref:3-oxoacyl-[acyl-carrier-protein] synthase-1 n=1 Tax=Reichenbachiella agariperforans TaxID=156994 RepID=A0A1M6PXG2_REIAG|nr:beta-ketoacyl synthase N-terminal-like domain-containing protein [Reichenbachiella agariperforans]SHK12685.1 3-oxoacyl-[acyl-carrier-protein] synthase-1 [Reichenbachiella agariperforans]
MSFIAAPHIISPLGNSVHENFERALVGQSALRLHSDHPFAPVDIPFGIITDHERSEGWTKLESLCLQSCQQSLAQLKDTSGKWLLIFCTTKGDIDRLASGLSEEVKPQYLVQKVAKELPIDIDTEVVSNACISGLLGVIMAHDYVSTGVYDHVLVLGGDLFSDFTYKGFESFMALSAQACKPFDANRDGLSLGEAVVSVVVSDKKEIFSQVDCQVLGGASANDANHISGPSRTGEGLYRSIQKTWKQTGLSAEEVDAVSAHGTATRYNDDMESIAFHRAGLAAKPINSMKGYFGHTLGAAGLLELVMSMESMRAGIFLSSLGCEAPGTTEEINVVTENTPMEIHTLLKTTSGFGGCNAAAIIQKIQ